MKVSDVEYYAKCKTAKTVLANQSRNVPEAAEQFQLCADR